MITVLIPPSTEVISLIVQDPMMEVSESERENELIEEARVGIQTTKTEHEQEEQLRQMMDAEMGTVLVRKPIAHANVIKDEVRESRAGEHNQSSGPVGDTQNQCKTLPAPHLASSGGRRRVKRKVLKKKTFKDEEGYLGVRPLVILVSMRLNLDYSYKRRTVMGIVLGRWTSNSERKNTVVNRKING